MIGREEAHLQLAVVMREAIVLDRKLREEACAEIPGKVQSYINNRLISLDPRWAAVIAGAEK